MGHHNKKKTQLSNPDKESDSIMFYSYGKGGSGVGRGTKGRGGKSKGSKAKGKH
jgi:hypothetical protein